MWGGGRRGHSCKVRAFTGDWSKRHRHLLLCALCWEVVQGQLLLLSVPSGPWGGAVRFPQALTACLVSWGLLSAGLRGSRSPFGCFEMLFAGDRLLCDCCGSQRCAGQGWWSCSCWGSGRNCPAAQPGTGASCSAAWVNPTRLGEFV